MTIMRVLQIPVVEGLLYELQRRELEADYRHHSKQDMHDLRRHDSDRSARSPQGAGFAQGALSISPGLLQLLRAFRIVGVSDQGHPFSKPHH
jgi:hypothetical protein